MAARSIASISAAAFSTNPPLTVPADRARFLRSRAFLFIPRLADQDRWAQSRSPMDMMVQGCPTRVFQAKQQ